MNLNQNIIKAFKLKFSPSTFNKHWSRDGEADHFAPLLSLACHFYQALSVELAESNRSYMTRNIRPIIAVVHPTVVFIPASLCHRSAIWVSRSGL